MITQHLDAMPFRIEEGKALTTTETEAGDLIIEGWAAIFDGLDRQGENFLEGAFQRGIKAFLSGQAALAYQHKRDVILGKVLDLREVPGKGLWMKARVDKQEQTSPWFHLYNGIRKGTINGLSIGGFFKRERVNGRVMIADMDFTEISATGVPMHGGTRFAVVAGKALTDAPGAVDDVAFDLALLRTRMNLARLEIASATGGRRAASYDPYTGAAL